MANQRILYTEEMVGYGHGTKADTLNRHAMVEHEEDGTHGAITPTSVVSSGAISGTTGTFTGLITATGGQIAFPATAVPSADPNTLDDYEEGTWTCAGVLSTPGDSSNANQLGLYQKVGGWVKCWGCTDFTKGTGTGTFTITGLPFAVQNTANYYPVVLILPYAMGAANETVCAYATLNTAIITVTMVPEGAGAYSNADNTDLGSTATIRVFIEYAI